METGINIPKKEDIETNLRIIEEDYLTCFRMIRRIYDYLDRFGLKDFNRYSKFKWTYDQDKSKAYNYVCIRQGSSLKQKCVIKRLSHVENADLYRWIEHKDMIQEALDEAYEYIYTKITTVKDKLENLKEIVEDYEEKLDDMTRDYEDSKIARKVLREFPLSLE